METIRFESHFFLSLLPCNITQNRRREIVPSNQSSWFVLLCYLMEGWNERPPTNSWPIPVWGKSLEVTICLISALAGAVLGCLLAKYEDRNEIWKQIRFLFFHKSVSLCNLVGSENMRCCADSVRSWLVDIASLKGQVKHGNQQFNCFFPSSTCVQWQKSTSECRTGKSDKRFKHCTDRSQ